MEKKVNCERDDEGEMSRGSDDFWRNFLIHHDTVYMQTVCFLRSPGSDISLFLLLCFIEILCRFIALLCRFIELLLRYIEIIIAIYRIIIAIY